MTNSKKLSTRKLVIIGMMSAVATVIYYLDFPIPFLLPNFIKLDFSNVISLLGGFAMGPLEGIIICLIKNLVHLVIKGFGTTYGIGDIFDFVTSAFFVLVSATIYHRNKTKKGAIIATFVGMIGFTVISLPLNYFIVYPIYIKAFGGEAAVMGAYRELLPRNKTKKGAIIATFVGMIGFTVISLPLNYFIVYPIYIKAFGGEAAVMGAYRELLPGIRNLFSALCIFNLPFTFVKGLLCSIITIIVYKPLSPVIKGAKNQT